MKVLRSGSCVAIFALILLLTPQISHEAEIGIKTLGEDNWTSMLEGEWLVKFMAPWCPACRDLKSTWRDLGKRAREYGIRVAEVDVTTSPGLSGRFLVTALPTIYHAYDGQFRQYKGPRDLDSILQYVMENKWQSTEPLAWWKEPTRAHMGALAMFFRLSQLLRTVHNELLETYGLPTLGSYLIFAVATILLGALLGLGIYKAQISHLSFLFNLPALLLGLQMEYVIFVAVCLIDAIYPPKGSISDSREPRPPSADVLTGGDDLVDEEEEPVSYDDQDAELISQSDTQSSDSELSQDEDAPANAGAPSGVHKRSVRRAD